MKCNVIMLFHLLHFFLGLRVVAYYTFVIYVVSVSCHYHDTALFKLTMLLEHICTVEIECEEYYPCLF